jgi:hypothetical protein
VNTEKKIILEEAAAFEHDRCFLENERPSGVEKMVDKIHYFYIVNTEKTGKWNMLLLLKMIDVFLKIRDYRR